MMNARLATSDLRHAAPQRSASLRLCVKKTALLLSPLRPLGGRHSLLHSPLRPLGGRNNAFTLFELLAVLTVIGIGLAILVGAYGSWGTAHALTGATRIVEAGLQQARTLAVTRRAYVAFVYGSEAINRTRVVTGFQTFLWTNDTVSAEAVISDMLNSGDGWAGPAGDLLPATPHQRLSGHVRLAYAQETAPSSPDSGSDMWLFFFRPDGSVFSNPADKYAHHIMVYSQERFHRSNNTSEPLLRYLRIDLATGTVTIIKPEVTP